MSNLTPEAEAATERLVPWIIIAALVFIGYAAAQHVGWMDATAGVFVLWFVCRAIRMAGRSSG